MDYTSTSEIRRSIKELYNGHVAEINKSFRRSLTLSLIILGSGGILCSKLVGGLMIHNAKDKSGPEARRYLHLKEELSELRDKDINVIEAAQAYTIMNEMNVLSTTASCANYLNSANKMRKSADECASYFGFAGYLLLPGVLYLKRRKELKQARSAAESQLVHLID